jgi:lipopolysaccharide biosynthesis glycosyltransferase
VKYSPKQVAILRARILKNSAHFVPVNIAFCFDENVMEQAKLSISSLLHNAGSVSYNIYCIVPKNFQQSHKSELENILAKQRNHSSIIFLEANNDFDQSYMWKTQAVYYRLMLPCLLPHLDKIIYADVDTVFHDNLQSADQINLNSNLIAGVKDILNVSSIWKREKDAFFEQLIRGEYINSGFLIMNLKELRSQNLYEKWLELSKGAYHKYPDQNILNYTCERRKLFLPLRYNLIPQIYARALLENVYSPQEYEEAISQSVMIHYAGRARELWKRSYVRYRSLNA